MIKIDISTIRRNKHYGMDGYRRLIPGDKIIKIDGEFANITDVWAAREAGKHVDITCDMIDVTTRYEPEYYYSYMDQLVQCDNCGQSFNHTELETEGDWGYDDINICPFCGESDCCDIEYEDIEDCITNNHLTNIPYAD